MKFMNDKGAALLEGRQVDIQHFSPYLLYSVLVWCVCAGKLLGVQQQVLEAVRLEGSVFAAA